MIKRGTNYNPTLLISLIQKFICPTGPFKGIAEKRERERERERESERESESERERESERESERVRVRE